MPHLGFQELLVVLLIVLVLFGAGKLPQIGRGLGEAIRNFKKGVSDPGELDVTPKKKVEDKKEKEQEEKS
jgi:sec-independent protein translocase protein TatA